MTPRSSASARGGSTWFAARKLLEHRAEHAPPAGALRRPSPPGRSRPRSPPLASLHPLPEVADHVIEAEAVVEARRVARARADPREVVGLHREPVVRRQPPVLTVRRVRVGRRAERQVQSGTARRATTRRRSRRTRRTAGPPSARRRARCIRARAASHCPSSVHCTYATSSRRRPSRARASSSARGAAIALGLGPGRPAPAAVRLAQRGVAARGRRAMRALAGRTRPGGGRAASRASTRARGSARRPRAGRAS